jgi:HIRAN domain
MRRIAHGQTVCPSVGLVLSATGAPMKTGKQLSITRKQSATEAGRALLAIVRTISEDGELTDEEALDLHRWLTSTVTGELPAADFLRDVVGRALEDGKITYDERQSIHEALIRVLPPDERSGAKDAKYQAFSKGWEAQREVEKKEWKAKRMDEVREAGMWEFVVAGVDYGARAAVVASSMEEGTPVQFIRDPTNKFDANAISVQLWDGRDIGFVPKEWAKELAPYLDAGAMAFARCTRLLTLGDIDRPLLQVGLLYLDGTNGLPGAPVHDWAAGVRASIPREKWPEFVSGAKVILAERVGPAVVADIPVPLDLIRPGPTPRDTSHTPNGSTEEAKAPQSAGPIVLALALLLALIVLGFGYTLLKR